MAYQARHGGASRDLLLRRLELEVIRKRGHWASYSSVRRYEKSRWLQRVVGRTHPRLLAWARELSPRVGELLQMEPEQLPPRPDLGP